MWTYYGSCGFYSSACSLLRVTCVAAHPSVVDAGHVILQVNGRRLDGMHSSVRQQYLRAAGSGLKQLRHLVGLGGWSFHIASNHNDRTWNSIDEVHKEHRCAQRCFGKRDRNARSLSRKTRQKRALSLHIPPIARHLQSLLMLLYVNAALLALVVVAISALHLCAL
eukprot:805230-Amphidinium_carterae.1